ncbi:MAG: LuxR C-terminal-related transcriptional regulator [Chloroflexi bacterium]|nr:LuxR C-terminal-related transcriptional regulator [Chloroflexota bacterium]MDA1146288.1 LuxR C-terminal-related transcriptional regulator [Chloroflexota bacterium]
MNGPSDGNIGRDAVVARDWGSAFATLEAADSAGTLLPPDLERFAVVAYLIAEDDRSAALWERAHHGYLAADDPGSAARCAFWLAFGMVQRGEPAQAGGWFARTERILDRSGVDSPVHGYLKLPGALQLLEERNPAEAIKHFEELAAIGERFDDLDLATLGRLGQGQSLIRLGEPVRGAALLDEAMVSVLAGDVGPVVAGIVYCAVIEVCQELFDLARAQEWTQALHRWCESQPDLVPFRGKCLLYRAEIMQLHGSWPDAAAETQRAFQILSEPPRPEIGDAYYRQGELQRLIGALPAAQEAFRRAADHGVDPEPGLALLRLDQGRGDAATTAIRHALNEHHVPATRARLLIAAVEIALAANDSALATVSLEELNALAGQLSAPFLEASAAQAAGAIALADDDLTEASTQLRQALTIWLSLGAPYEAARTRVLLARVADGEGDTERATAERTAARDTFEHLGAANDLARLAAEGGTSTAPGWLTPRELKILSLVATGMTNRAIAEHLTISDKTVARHVSNIFGKLGLSSRSAATAYAYEHDLL